VNPSPDAEAWLEIGDPGERLQRALDEVYAYYERTEPMYSNVLRDAGLVAAVQAALEPQAAFLARCAEILAVGRPERGRRRRVVEPVLAHVLAFDTWPSLAIVSGLPRADVVRLAAALVAAAGS
jgi:hypothetical protein